MAEKDVLFIGFDHSIRVAVGAIRQWIQCNPSLCVVCRNWIGLVIVAAVAGDYYIVSRMACLAFDLTLTSVVEGEAMSTQLCWDPRLSCVAVLALQTEEPSVYSWFCVALHAFGGRATEYLILVACGAFQIGMATIQREKTGVIEIAHAVSAIMALKA